MKLTKEQRSLLNQASALAQNILAWVLSYLPAAAVSKPAKLIKNASSLDGQLTLSKANEGPAGADSEDLYCIQINAPGGTEQLQMEPLSNRVTVGYNIPGIPPPFFTLPSDLDSLPANLVLVRVQHFSVNYADVCIRWGLYESALQYVGWPIVPGFDLSGQVEWAGSETSFKKGDMVFGFTMFGAYSARCLVPASQIRVVPPGLLPPHDDCRHPVELMQRMAALPAVAATALHALHLAGMWPPGNCLSANKGVLVHSAAGGVGSMLLQMSEVLGCAPIVAVVGSKHKIKFCEALGAGHVIDKSSQPLWSTAESIAPNGFAAVFDANGVETLADSYAHLARCGHLVIYGFHTNVPKAQSFLSPWAWAGMIRKLLKMPAYDPMNLVLDSKTVSGFNLSFFADERELIEAYMKQIIEWVTQGSVQLPDVTVYTLSDVAKAHESIQSGLSVGKIVVSI